MKEILGNITLYNADCMDIMREIPDKEFDLAIVDPPYGIDIMHLGGMPKHLGFRKYERKDWDKKRPDKEYFEELFRVSKNKIIWGANYFAEYLPASMGWVVWDKGQKLTMSDGELAFTSFHKALRIVTFNRCYIGEYGGNVHRAQKPVRLYKWLLDKYAKAGDKIIDTHLGSASIAIACNMSGLEFTGIEIDPEYYACARQRLINQLGLFNTLNQ
mgnify:CR=1 FL=1|jgi:site-specific DNA-methyltransferase (adenine-specific)